MRKTIHSTEQKKLCRLLRQLRLASGLRQEEVAVHLGKPQSFVSKYESGERRLDLLELRQVCGALGVTLPDFVTRLEDLLE